MIALSSDCLLFETNEGESIPFSAEMISVELMGGSSKLLEEEFVKQASKAVFHYFKHELGRQTVSVGEFAGALEKALSALGCRVTSSDDPPQNQKPCAADLRRIASEAAGGCELFFFPRLRDALRDQLKQAPRLVRFHGLRGCVKQLAGARRWSRRCQTLEERILHYLRECVSAERSSTETALLVE